jgi:hypothetical protein
MDKHSGRYYIKQTYLRKGDKIWFQIFNTNFFIIRIALKDFIVHYLLDQSKILHS